MKKIPITIPTTTITIKTAILIVIFVSVDRFVLILVLLLLLLRGTITTSVGDTSNDNEDELTVFVTIAILLINVCRFVVFVVSTCVIWYDNKDASKGLVPIRTLATRSPTINVRAIELSCKRRDTDGVNVILRILSISIFSKVAKFCFSVCCTSVVFCKDCNEIPLNVIFTFIYVTVLNDVAEGDFVFDRVGVDVIVAVEMVDNKNELVDVTVGVIDKELEVVEVIVDVGVTVVVHVSVIVEVAVRVIVPVGVTVAETDGELPSDKLAVGEDEDEGDGVGILLQVIELVPVVEMLAVGVSEGV